MSDEHPFGNADAQAAIRQLPFVQETEPGHLEFWNIEGIGADATDIALGETCAGMALAVAREFDLPVMVAMILRDMVRIGKFSGVEAGFIASIASAARVGSFH